MRRELPGKERLDVECHASAPFQHANTFVQNVLHSGEISQQRLYSIPKLYGGEVTIMSTQLSGIRHSTSQQSPQTIVFDKSQAVPRLSARMTTSGYKNRTVPFLHLQKFSNLRGKISVILHAPVQAACFEKCSRPSVLRPIREQAMARRYSVTASLGIAANNSNARSL